MGLVAGISTECSVSIFRAQQSEGLGLQFTTSRICKGMSKGWLVWFQSITDVADVAQSSDYKWRLHSAQSTHVISFSKAEYVLICRNRNDAIFRFRRTKSGLSALADLWLSVFSPHGASAFSRPRPPHYRGFTITIRHTTLHRTDASMFVTTSGKIHKSTFILFMCYLTLLSQFHTRFCVNDINHADGSDLRISYSSDRSSW